MVHKNGSELARKIWNGEYLGENGALAHGLTEYHKTRKRTVWASTLYSALNRILPSARAGDWEAIRASAWCFWQLAPLVRHWEAVGTRHPQSIDFLYTPDECDVIASALLAWYRLPWTSGRYALAAEMFAKSAYDRTKHEESAHTPALAALTLARTALMRLKHAHRSVERHRQEAQRHLAEAYMRAARIADPNQRSRVYRGCAEGVVSLKGHTHDALRAASCALDAADAVIGIAPDVQAKNALLRARLKF